MTMIVSGFKTKKAFKETMLAEGEAIPFEDPALMPEWKKYGRTYFTLGVMEIGDTFCVTNHPKRSWFAEVKCTAAGQYKVS
jgi:hypothetical protein